MYSSIERGGLLKKIRSEDGGHRSKKVEVVSVDEEGGSQVEEDTIVVDDTFTDKLINCLESTMNSDWMKGSTEIISNLIHALRKDPYPTNQKEDEKIVSPEDTEDINEKIVSPEDIKNAEVIDDTNDTNEDIEDDIQKEIEQRFNYCTIDNPNCHLDGIDAANVDLQVYQNDK